MFSSLDTEKKEGADQAVSIIFDEKDIDRIIEMAWEDRTPLEAIRRQFGLPENKVIELMRRHLSAAGFRKWRSRVAGRRTKHAALRGEDVSRFKSNRQRHISSNKISKR